MSIEVRVLNHADAEEFSALRNEALTLAPLAFTESAGEHRARSIEEIANRITEGDNFVIGAFETPPVMMGCAGFIRGSGPKTRHKGRGWGMWVSPPYREQGIGRRLMAALIGRVRAIDGVSQILLGVTAHQQSARLLYASLGFVAYGREPDALRVDGESVDEELMILWLASR